MTTADKLQIPGEYKHNLKFKLADQRVYADLNPLYVTLNFFSRLILSFYPHFSHLLWFGVGVIGWVLWDQGV